MTIGNLIAGVGRTHPSDPDPISIVCSLLLHLRLCAAVCYEADNVFYALSTINPVQEKLNRSWVTNARCRANCLSCSTRMSWPAGWNALIGGPSPKGDSSMKK